MGFGGFSWKRATGLTRAKTKVSRAIGIPLTKGGRQRKFGAMIGGSVLGGLPTKRRKSSNSEISSLAAQHNIDEDEITGKLVPYGIDAKSMSCTALIAIILVSLISPPFSLILFPVLYWLYSRRQRKKTNKSIDTIAAKVSEFKQRMDIVTLPEVKPLTRGSPDKVYRYEENREKELRIAQVLADIGYEPAIRFVSLLAACGTMRELDNDGGRASILYEMADSCGFPETAYLIPGFYSDDIPYVDDVLRSAGVR